MLGMLGPFQAFMFINKFAPNIYEFDHWSTGGSYHLDLLKLIRAWLRGDESRVILRFFLFLRMPYTIEACFQK